MANVRPRVIAKASLGCDEIIFDATNILLLENVQDDGVSPPTDIEGGTVTALLTDEADDSTILGPLSLTEFPSAPSNDWRTNFDATAAAGFSVGQRVLITYSWDDGGLLVRKFPIVALVVEGGVT